MRCALRYFGRGSWALRRARRTNRPARLASTASTAAQSAAFLSVGLEGNVAIERFVAGGVGLKVADVAVDLRTASRRASDACRSPQSAEPRSADSRRRCRRAPRPRTGGRRDARIRASPPTPAPWPRPGILAVGRTRVGIAAVGAHQTIDHGLERAGYLVPVDRRQPAECRAPPPRADKSRSSSHASARARNSGSNCRANDTAASPSIRGLAGIEWSRKLPTSCGWRPERRLGIPEDALKVCARDFDQAPRLRHFSRDTCARCGTNH